VRGPTQFANELNPYSDYVVTDVYSTELEIRLSFVGISGGVHPPGTPLLSKATLTEHHLRF
jgi:hypothetical protein